MRTLTSMIIAAVLTIAVAGTTCAQWTITIPKLPKIKIDKPAEPSTSTATTGSRAESAGFDAEAFNSFTLYHSGEIDGFLTCYANKHNLQLKDVTHKTYGLSAYGNYKPLNEQVEGYRSKLAELEQLLKSKFPSRPNTGKQSDDNPAIWDEITSKREEYIQCELTAYEDESSDPRVSMFRDEVKETRKDVDEYSPQTKTAVVSGKNWEWLERAVSPSVRKTFLDKWNSVMLPRHRKGIEIDLDAISAALPAKLALFTKEKINGFPLRNPAEERMMRGKMGDVPGATIYKIGLYGNQWLISKDDWGLPTSRYKQGAIYFRDPASDHQYCWLNYINIIQTYSGGGTYAASYAKYVGADLVTCQSK